LTGGTAVPGRHQKHQGKHRPQGRQHLLKVQAEQPAPSFRFASAPELWRRVD